MCIVINSARESEGGEAVPEKGEGAAEREGDAAERERDAAAEKREEAEGGEAAGGTSSKEARNGYVNHIYFHLLITTFANL